ACAALALSTVGEAGCPQLLLPGRAPGPALDEKVILNADEVSLDRDGLSELAGAVILSQGDKTFSAEALRYDDANRIVTVGSESLFRNPALIVKSQRSRFDLNARSGVFMDTEFVLPSRSARGTATELKVDAEGDARLKGASYTTCGSSSNAWFVRAGEIHLDQKEGLGSARNVHLDFLGVPILYVPYLQFPIDDRRRTGLLYPTIGQLSGTGVDFRWPVYINLAANYDATVTPRLMSERGLQSAVDFRYLLKQSEGLMRYEYLDDRKLGEDRSLFRLSHNGLINRRLGLEAVYAETTDRTYFEDLGGTLSSSSITHLEQSARLTYQAPASYRITTMVQNFQPIASNLTAADDPYKRLPQIRFEALTRNAFLDTRAGIHSEFVNFAREDSVEGVRLLAAPFLRFERDASAWYLRGQADLNHTHYELSGVSGNRPEQQERTLPVVSAETGLNFERVTTAGRLQTLTPRAFALYVPYTDQDRIPLFDTGEPGFDFVQLFARNRFSGEDRLADARHVAGAATLRELDPQTGRTRWSASVGQLYRLTAPRVTVPGLLPPEDGATEFITQFDYYFSEHWRTLAAAQWAPEENHFERAQFGLRYRDQPRRRQIDLSYRYRRDLLEQADFSFLTPISGSWLLAGRTRYSLQDSESRESFLGVEYGTCCWAVRVSHRRFISNSSGDMDSGVYVQLQLKGLANIGTGSAELLPDRELDGERPP
ncbi:MAG: LPS-assembly protein LptD, partial [Panacagrimonas sp.]